MMDSMAVQNYLLSYQNGLLYDVPGRPQSPYFLKRIQLVAPLADSIHGGNVQFKYFPELFKTNLALILNSISITAFNQSPVNLPLDGTPVNVLITQSGTATFQVQVTYTNGQQFSQTCSLQISNNNTANRMMGEGDPDGSYWWSSTIPFQGYDESAAYCGKNLINVYYKTGSNTLTKPIIIVDGFCSHGLCPHKPIH